MALEGKRLPKNFYEEIAEATKTTRDQVKFLMTKAIGAKNRAISLKPPTDEKDWYLTDFILFPEQRISIEEYISKHYPDLYKHLYKAMGVHLQGLEGTILMDTMLELLDLGIPSLPIHDAVYVQRRHAKQAQKVLEKVWMKVLGVKFKPYTKIDTALNTN